MTTEEIERTLQLVVSNQARLSEAHIRFGERQAQLDELIKQVAASHQAIIEHFRGQDESHNRWRGVPDERLTGPISAHVKYDVRQEWLEEAFRQVAESHHVIVQLASVHGDRLDGHDKAMVQTENRFSALVEAQIQLSHCVLALTSNIATIGAHLDQTAEQIKSLATAQTRKDEKIKRGASTKTRRKSTKLVKRGRPNNIQSDSTSLENNLPGEPEEGRNDTGPRDEI